MKYFLQSELGWIRSVIFDYFYYKQNCSVTTWFEIGNRNHLKNLEKLIL